MSAETAAPVRFNPFTAEFRDDPYPHYRRLREERPAHKTLGMWVLTRHSDVMAVLRDRSFSAALIPQLVGRHTGEITREQAARIERLGAKSLVFTDNPDHARLRGLVNRVFVGSSVAELRSSITSAVQRLLSPACAAGEFDAITQLAEPLPIAVMCDWMAIPADIRPQAARWTHQIRLLLEPGLMSDGDFSVVGTVLADFVETLEHIAAKRRSRPGDDLISRLIAARTANGDRLTEEELVFVCIMCFVAGNETTKSLIGNALLALARHPEQLGRLREDSGLLPGAVDEALRYDSPLQMTKRLSTRDVALDDVEIRAGEQVLLCLGAANRDPAVFPQPDDFDVAREPRAHLAFGYGMHGCLGGALAQMQATVVLEQFTRQVGSVQLCTDRLEWQDHSFIVRGLKRLPLALGRPA